MTTQRKKRPSAAPPSDETKSSEFSSPANSLGDHDVDGADEFEESISRQPKSYGLRSVGTISDDGSDFFHAQSIGDASTEFSTTRRRGSSALHTKLEPSQRKVSVGELPIAQLKTTCKSLYGRKNEIKIVQNCCRDLLENNQRQILLISGYSGAGKSALASVLADTVTKNNKGLYVKGKFDYQHNTEPYSAISMACREICGVMLQLAVDDPEEFETVKKEMKTKLGPELPILTQLIPALDEVIMSESPPGLNAGDGGGGGGSAIEMDIHSANKGLNSTESKNRIIYAFQRFLWMISRQFRSLLLVIDDLQWADVASLELLDKIVLEREQNAMMIIGIYRSNEVDNKHPFGKLLEEWRDKADSLKCTLTEIELGNLDLSSVTAVVQDMLQSDDPTTLDLAELCYKKTHGNIFFLRLLLSTLYENRLLQYNIGTFRWTWDAAEIEGRIPASDNVVDLLKANMANLPPKQLEVLKLATCFGSSFKSSLLQTIMLKASSISESFAMDVLPDALSGLVNEGYIEKMGRDHYRFAHDKIQETSALMIPEADRMDYFHRVGHALLESLDAQEIGAVIFMVTDLLNKGTAPVTEWAKMELANLNCQACRKAIVLSAFSAAAEYAKRAIGLLGDDKWEKHYKLSLDLHSMAAEAESSLGQLEAMERHCNEVLAQKNRPLEDKFRVYHTLIFSTGNLGRMREAADQSLELLESFGCRFPKGKVSTTLKILSEVIHLKLTVNSWSSEGIKKLKVNRDPVRFELSRIMDSLATSMYVCGDERMPLAILRNLHWTQKYGVTDYSPSALVTTGLILAGALGDFRAGAMLGESAIRLLGRVERRSLVESRVMYVHYGMVLHWSAPFKDMLRPLLHAYEAGLKSGDSQSACVAAYFFMLIRYNVGTSLERMHEDAMTYAVQMKDLKQIQTLISTRINRQLYLNLMGRGTNGNPLMLDGESIGTEELEKLRQHDLHVQDEAKRCESLLWSYFGAHEKLAALVLKEKGADLSNIGSAGHMHYLVVRGVSSFAAYRSTKNKGYLSMGMLMRSKLNSWLEKGNPNILHFVSLLNAEYKACKGKTVKAIKLFESAVLLSGRSGLLLDAAYISERFGELYLELGDEDNASFRFRQSIQYYQEIDAFGKVDDLEERYPHFFEKPKEINIL